MFPHPGTDLVVGVWEGGRVGTFRGIRSGKATYGANVFGSKAVMPGGTYGGYQPLVIEIGEFFKTGKPPVSAEETIELFAFMEAADESKRQGGRPVSIEEVMRKSTRGICQVDTRRNSGHFPRGFTRSRSITMRYISRLTILIGFAVIFAVAQHGMSDEPALPLKAGIIGLDAHARPWTQILNNPEAQGELADIVVVAGYAGGSPDIPQSQELLKRGVETFNELDIELVDSIGRAARESRRGDDPEH